MKHVVACVVNSWESVLTEFFLCWTELFAYSATKHKVSLLVSRFPYIDYAREKLIEQALEMQPDYIFCLDIDHTFQRDIIERLIRHIDDGKLIVSGVTAVRRSGQPLVYDFKEGEDYRVYYRLNVPKNKLIKVGGVGMGCGVMMQPKVFTEILKPPYFQQGWDVEREKRIGEDVFFFQKCNKAGIDVWCDTGIVLGHLTIGATLPDLKE